MKYSSSMNSRAKALTPMSAPWPHVHQPSQIPHTVEMVRNNKSPSAPSSEYQGDVYKSSLLVPCAWQSGCQGSRSQREARGGGGGPSRKALDSSHLPGKY